MEAESRVDKGHTSAHALLRWFSVTVVVCVTAVFAPPHEGSPPSSRSLVRAQEPRSDDVDVVRWFTLDHPQFEAAGAADFASGGYVHLSWLEEDGELFAVNDWDVQRVRLSPTDRPSIRFEPLGNVLLPYYAFEVESKGSEERIVFDQDSRQPFIGCTTDSRVLIHTIEHSELVPVCDIPVPSDLVAVRDNVFTVLTRSEFDEDKTQRIISQWAAGPIARRLRYWNAGVLDDTPGEVVMLNETSLCAVTFSGKRWRSSLAAPEFAEESIPYDERIPGPKPYWGYWPEMIYDVMIQEELANSGIVFTDGSVWYSDGVLQGDSSCEIERVDELNKIIRDNPRAVMEYLGYDYAVLRLRWGTVWQTFPDRAPMRRPADPLLLVLHREHDPGD